MSAFSPDSLINQSERMFRNLSGRTFFYFVPQEEVLPFTQMNPHGADPYGSACCFLQEPGK